ncbi:MAG: DNA polymerase IV [Actinobacteria bacterium]|nr:DNA polymerase IV [Actinomycetota bacterium]MSZ46176.1 DNA polymerase IV [Actinomycetota bacterium]MTA04260.1 DNA polymerase IV [Actinomycetota bacterium]MTA22729.1 DNA polymerase IV [Actinomycetota bacterium]
MSEIEQAMDEKLSTILHVDMDAFYASVAEKDNPALRGKALVVGAGARGVVLSANYEARKFGIRAAMPVGRAQRMAPHAIFVAPDHHRYSEVSEVVMEIFRSVSPLVEPLSLDEAFIDVTGAKRLLGTGREIAESIRAQVFKSEGITCSVGIATTKFIAKLASDRCKPNGVLEIAHDRVLEFLHPLPVSAVWGVGPKTAEELMKLGLRTVEDIAKTPRATLIRALGEATGAHLYELAWGRDYRDVVPDEPDKSISNAETFASDIEDTEILLRELLRLTEKATHRMRESNKSARTISIKVRFADFKTISRSKTVPLPISGTQEVYEIVRALFNALKLDGARLRLVGVGLDGLVEGIDGPEQIAFGEREKGWREATKAIDAASTRFGAGSVRPARLFEPESEDSE